MANSETQLIETALRMLKAAEVTKAGVAAHIAQHPELDNDTKVILEMSSEVIGMLTKLCAKQCEESVTMSEALKEIRDALS